MSNDQGNAVLKKIIFAILAWMSVACGDQGVLDTANQRITVPHLAHSSPADGFANFPVTNHITIHFSTPMDGDSVIDNLSFYRGGIEVVHCTNLWLSNMSVLVLCPTNALLTNQPYLINISTLAKASNGINLSSNIIIRFATDLPDLLPPVILGINPTNNERGFPVNQAITVQFNEGMNTNSTESAFSLLDENNNEVTGTFYWVQNSMFFQPDNDLHPLRKYTILISTNARDMSGNALAASELFSFTAFGRYQLIRTMDATNCLALAFNDVQDMYFADNTGLRIHKLEYYGYPVLSWTMSNAARGLHVGPAGDVFVSESANHAVKKYDANGNYYGWFGRGDIATGFHDHTNTEAHLSGTADGQFSSPAGVLVDAQSNIFVVDSGNNRVQKLSVTGNCLVTIGSGLLNNPTGIALDPGGNIYITDTGNHLVRKFSASGSIITNFGGLGAGDNSLNTPTAIAVDRNTNVFVADCGNNRIQCYDQAGVSYFQITNGAISGIGSLLVSAGGELFISDTNSNLILVFAVSKY